MAKSEPWICKSCGWRNYEIPHMCENCNAEKLGRPKNVAVVVERTGFGNLKTYEKRSTSREKYRHPVDVQTWPNGISWG